jgi:hypothetical protein
MPCDWLETPQGWKGGGWPMNCSQERRKLAMAVPSSAPRQYYCRTSSNTRLAARNKHALQNYLLKHFAITVTMAFQRYPRHCGVHIYFLFIGDPWD